MSEWSILKYFPRLAIEILMLIDSQKEWQNDLSIRNEDEDGE